MEIKAKENQVWSEWVLLRFAVYFRDNYLKFEIRDLVFYYKKDIDGKPVYETVDEIFEYYSCSQMYND